MGVVSRRWVVVESMDVHFFNFFRSCSGTFIIYVIIFSRSINTYERLRASHGSYMKRCT